MLVLTRRKDELIVMRHAGAQAVEVRLQVLEIKGDRVKLGLTAPEGVAIARPEWLGREKKPAQQAG
jgi:carbon storage regulator CsrA